MWIYKVWWRWIVPNWRFTRTPARTMRNATPKPSFRFVEFIILIISFRSAVWFLLLLLLLLLHFFFVFFLMASLTTRFAIMATTCSARSSWATFLSTRRWRSCWMIWRPESWPLSALPWALSFSVKLSLRSLLKYVEICWNMLKYVELWEMFGLNSRDVLGGDWIWLMICDRRSVRVMDWRSEPTRCGSPSFSCWSPSPCRTRFRWFLTAFLARRSAPTTTERGSRNWSR